MSNSTSIPIETIGRVNSSLPNASPKQDAWNITTSPTRVSCRTPPRPGTPTGSPGSSGSPGPLGYNRRSPYRSPSHRIRTPPPLRYHPPVGNLFFVQETPSKSRGISTQSPSLHQVPPTLTFVEDDPSDTFTSRNSFRTPKNSAKPRNCPKPPQRRRTPTPTRSPGSPGSLGYNRQSPYRSPSHRIRTPPPPLRYHPPVGNLFFVQETPPKSCGIPIQPPKFHKVPPTLAFVADDSSNPFDSRNDCRAPKDSSKPKKPASASKPSEDLVLNNPTFKRDRSCVTFNEYCILAMIFKSLSLAPEPVQQWISSLGNGSRSKELSLLTGVSESTCRKAIDFSITGTLKGGEAKRSGPPQQALEMAVSNRMMEIVVETNKLGLPNSSNRIANQLRDEKVLDVSVSTIRRYLHKLGLHWGKGIRQNILHDAPQNVKFRRQYLARRLQNLGTLSDGRLVPKRPEVFLDESYCHLDHAAAKRWVSTGGAVSEPGRKPLLVIFAAFVVYYDADTDEVVGKFVKDSVHIWPAKSKKGLSNGLESLQDADLWKDVPDVIRSSNVIAKDDDYHGNFNSETFNGIFRKLCENLRDMGLGPCHIHLDGASYHFSKVNRKPTTRSTKEDILNWYAVTNNLVPHGKNGRPPTNHEMLAYIKSLPDQPFSISKIAEEIGGHEIFKTPPYHCELQPIEKIWAVVKNKVAAYTTGKMTPLRLKRTLTHYFCELKDSTFISVWAKSVKIGQAYYDALDKLSQGDISSASATATDHEEESHYPDEDELRSVSEADWEEELQEEYARYGRPLVIIEKLDDHFEFEGEEYEYE